MMAETKTGRLTLKLSQASRDSWPADFACWDRGVGAAQLAPLEPLRQRPDRSAAGGNEQEGEETVDETGTAARHHRRAGSSGASQMLPVCFADRRWMLLEHLDHRRL